MAIETFFTHMVSYDPTANDAMETMETPGAQKTPEISSEEAEKLGRAPTASFGPRFQLWGAIPILDFTVFP